MFSSRLPDRLTPNALGRALAGLRESGVAILDLTATNPTKVGLAYPADLLNALSQPGGRSYKPDPLGLLEARQVVANECLRRRKPVSADRVVLTASTSEAYGLLFKLLCDSGDEVLVPQPSYPLFELLTRLEGVSAQPYRLQYHGVWSIDRATVERALTGRTRAVLVVCPNNPTGSMLRESDSDWLVRLCAARGLALIVDEVFIDYPVAPRPDACSLLGERRALTFSLGGLSKSAGLPQVKLGWIVVSGPEALAVEALARLEVICDTYLSVSTPVQLAASRLVEAGRKVRTAIAARVSQNLQALKARLAAYPSVSLLEPEGGWSAVLQIPAIQPEEELALRLLQDRHVLVHPGYFFDFQHEAFIVISLLPETDAFGEACERMLPVAAGEGGA
jgi:alanine-synthesizing transaminase